MENLYSLVNLNITIYSRSSQYPNQCPSGACQHGHYWVRSYRGQRKSFHVCAVWSCGWVSQRQRGIRRVMSSFPRKLICSPVTPACIAAFCRVSAIIPGDIPWQNLVLYIANFCMLLACRDWFKFKYINIKTLKTFNIYKNIAPRQSTTQGIPPGDKDLKETKGKQFVKSSIP